MPNRTFADLRRGADDAAVIDADGIMTWDALRTQTLGWMLRARAAGARQDHPLVILGHKEASFVYAVLGCLSMGIPYVPVDTVSPVEHIRQIVDRVGARFIFDTKTNRFIEHKAVSGPLDERNLAYVMFTPDCNGGVKGALIGHEGLVEFSQWVGHYLRLGKAPVIMDQSLFNDDFSVFGLTAALSTGGTYVLCTREAAVDRDAFLYSMAKNRVMVWASTPAQARQQLLHAHFDQTSLPDLRLFVFRSARAETWLVNALFERFPQARILNLFGTTETTCSTAWAELAADTSQLGTSHYPIGQPKPYAEVFLHDGELCVAGDHVMRGYIDPTGSRSPQLFLHKGRRAIRTGHLGAIDQNGMAYSCGRLDEQIQHHGRVVNLAEVDEKIAGLPGVRTGLAVPLRRPDGSILRIIGMVEPVDAVYGEGVQPLPDALLGWRGLLGDHLPGYMVPSELVACSPLSTTLSNHTDRRRLERLYLDAHLKFRQAS